MKRRVIIYARVSTIMQEEKDSLEFQIKNVKNTVVYMIMKL